MDLSSLVNRSLEAIEKHLPFPAFPGPKGGDLEKQVPDNKEISSISRISSPRNEMRNNAEAGSRESEENCSAPAAARVVSYSSPGKPGKTGKDSTSSDLGSARDLEKPGRELEKLEKEQATNALRARSRKIDRSSLLPEAVTWLDGLRRLSPHQAPCPGFRAGQWREVYATSLAFLQEFGDQAVSLGWTTRELFGVHPEVGVVRVDYAGALMLSGHSRIATLTADTIRYEDGLAYRRAPRGLAIPVWNFEVQALGHVEKAPSPPQLCKPRLF